MGKIKALVAVSGGPDSIYLLDKLYSLKKYDLKVAHVNYHLRPESNDEQQYVKEFCGQRKIDLFIKDVSNNDWETVSFLKNKQSEAREIRYKFFLDIMNKKNIKKLFVAQHRDDFIETAIMQERKSKDYLFYGIQDKLVYKDSIVYRPLLNLYKNEIIEKLNKKNIKFMIDASNEKLIYDRNIIRKKLSTKTTKQKEEIYKYYNSLNKSRELLRKRVKKVYKDFKESLYSVSFFRQVDFDLKKYIVYELLINSERRIKINSSKIEGVIDFIEKYNGQNKSYRLMENVFLEIKKDKIILSHK